MTLRPTRRELLRGAVAAPLLSAFTRAERPIDRLALVRRHNVVLTEADVHSPLQVGNGEFAFTADITGLQTFAADYERGMPLGTMAQWAWHSFPPDPRLDLRDIYTDYDAHGRAVSYADGKGGYPPEAPPRTAHPAVWLRANPHRIHLGRIGLVLRGSGGRTPTLADITRPRQELDLWSGLLTSRFVFEGRPVEVDTVCHPALDMVAFHVRSPLVVDGGLGIAFEFAFPAGEWSRTADWDEDERHVTARRSTGQGTRFERLIDGTRYVAVALVDGAAALRQTKRHGFEWTRPGHEHLELSIQFAPDDPQDGASFADARAAAERHWSGFWTQGAAVDVSDSSDARAPELERRIVLSQYLTAVNCAGTTPPQETGLVTNSWYGKFHLEMHWWHAAHFALWGRAALLERSMPWYRSILPAAREIARRQGYEGVRWPKQVGPDGRESPSAVAVFLIWQQPHPIFFAELLYRASPTRATLDRYADLVFESAAFMASFAAWEPDAGRYVLGPPLIPAQESYGGIRDRVMNPTFELAYWHWGLTTAQRWRERVGLAPLPAWERVASRLARPVVRNGVYTAIESEPFTIRSDHPSMLAALGVLPETPLVEPRIMKRTLDDVVRAWDWESTWGWDYPVMAMTAARTGHAAAAIDALLMDAPKNRYLPNGHNVQTERLPLYLPGNGGLLYAAAMMAGGWDGAPAVAAPGFPRDGRWRARAEGFASAI